MFFPYYCIIGVGETFRIFGNFFIPNILPIVYFFINFIILYLK